MARKNILTSDFFAPAIKAARFDTCGAHQKIFRTVVALGRSLKRTVAAEGIETHEQFHRLKRLGATIGRAT
ncbi:MAG: hypothetical protein ABI460_16880 [Caldimonas sp.]